MKYIFTLIIMTFSCIMSAQSCNKDAILLESKDTKYQPYNDNTKELTKSQLKKQEWSVSKKVGITYDTIAANLFIDYPNQIIDISADSIIEYGLDYFELADLYIHKNPNYENKRCPRRVYTDIIYRTDQDRYIEYKYLYSVYEYQKRIKDDEFYAQKRAERKAKRRKAMKASKNK